MRAKLTLVYGIVAILLIMFLGYETWQRLFAWVQRAMSLQVDYRTVEIGTKLFVIGFLSMAYWLTVALTLFFISKWVNKKIER